MPRGGPGRFNSGLVRLKADTETPTSFDSFLFQFRSGAIKGVAAHDAICLIKAGFNSGLVRLKACHPCTTTRRSDIVSIPVWCD